VIAGIDDDSPRFHELFQSLNFEKAESVWTAPWSPNWGFSADAEGCMNGIALFSRVAGRTFASPQEHQSQGFFAREHLEYFIIQILVNFLNSITASF
jgi:hypothetical protein